MLRFSGPKEVTMITEQNNTHTKNVQNNNEVKEETTEATTQAAEIQWSKQKPLKLLKQQRQLVSSSSCSFKTKVGTFVEATAYSYNEAGQPQLMEQTVSEPTWQVDPCYSMIMLNSRLWSIPCADTGGAIYEIELMFT